MERITLESIPIVVGREEDGRWWADIESMPGVMAYGETRELAIAAVRALALRAAADYVEHGEDCVQDHCACMDAVTDVDEVREADGSIPIKDFSEMREKCPALREVFLPDSIWQQFQDWHSLPDDAAAHRSILLLAFRRGYLSRVTAPIHRYIVSSAGVLQCVRKQYVKDLRETWMLVSDPIDRNGLSRMFRGRLVELQFALWLESQEHKVVGLEATRDGPDIETVSSSGVANTFEVKFIGAEDEDFKLHLKSIAGLPAAGFVSPHIAMDYLLFRVYEAARKLRAVPGTKTAVVVIDDTTWFRFTMQLVNWTNPQFVSDEDGWNRDRFFAEQQKRYPGLRNDLAPTLQKIDSVKIFRQTSAFEFRLQLAFPR